MNTFTLAIVAHLLGDFVLQPTRMVERKRHLGWLTAHGLIVTAATMLLVGTFIPKHMDGNDWLFFGVLMGSHLLIDALKTYLMPDTWWSFLLDQVLHIGVIAGLCLWLGDISKDGIWGDAAWKIFNADQFKLYLRCCVVVGGYVACCFFGGVLIGKLTTSIAPHEAGEGIAGAGKYIGWLERSIAMTLVLASELSGIGFLITAKSILRFGNSNSSAGDNNEANRKASEYIIIGTFLSFGWGLAIAMLTQKLQGFYK